MSQPQIEKDKTVTAQILSWAAGQPFNNVLLLMILSTFSYGLWFGMQTAIPSHLKQIQDGYEKLVESHKDERERTIQTYDKWVDRMTKTTVESPPEGNGAKDSTIASQRP